MEKEVTMDAVFDPLLHLAKCLELPTRDPEQYWRPEKKNRTRYLPACSILVRHQGEVEKLQKQGVPFYLAETLVVIAYAHTEPRLEKHIQEAKQR
jgi:hypothetical protein